MFYSFKQGEFSYHQPIISDKKINAKGSSITSSSCYFFEGREPLPAKVYVKPIHVCVLYSPSLGIADELTDQVYAVYDRIQHARHVLIVLGP